MAAQWRKDLPVTESACIQDTDFYKKHVNQYSAELKPDLSLLCFPLTRLMHTVLTSIIQLFLLSWLDNPCVPRTPLSEWWARRRDLSLTPHNTHKRQISMPRRDLKPQSQRARGRRPTPLTARHWHRHHSVPITNNIDTRHHLFVIIQWS